MLTPLLQGLSDANFLSDFSWSGNVLTVHLKSDLYGQIATGSRVPSMWKVKKTLQFTVVTEGAKTIVHVEGLSLWGAGQSIELYKKAMTYAGRDGSSCSDSSCVAQEISAAGKYLQDKWSDFKGSPKKVTNILKSASYASTFSPLYILVKSLGLWPNIFYGMLLSAPNKVKAFTFEHGKVSMAVVPDDEHPKFQEYKKLHIFEKGDAMRQLLLQSSKSVIEKGLHHAESATNLVLALTDGYPGERSSIAKLMTLCPGAAPGTDPKCSGSVPGRVAWGPAVASDMV